jgi:hypothetical protein
MTSEERNRRMKYGHEVPRSWIPEFNATHPNPTNNPWGKRSESDATSNIRTHSEIYKLKRRIRTTSLQRQQASANKVMRWIKQITAALLVAFGFFAGGYLGLAIGAVAGLSLISLRVELYNNSK